MPAEQPNLGRILAVSSGKGGVGKSTVAVNVAVALAQDGARVGVMDADIYGPNIPRMFGVFEKPPVIGGKIQPLEAHGVKLMSLGFLVERDAPAIWRGPIIMKIVTQFLRDVNWGELDYFIVDLPPGTGDAQLSLVQATQVSGAVIVTTPQEMAVGDALRGAKMFERVGVPVIGVVENMSAFTDPETGRRFELFSSGGGQRLAEEIGVAAARQRAAPAAAGRAGRRRPADAHRQPRQPGRRKPARHRRPASPEDRRPERRASRSCGTEPWRPSGSASPSWLCASALSRPTRAVPPPPGSTPSSRMPPRRSRRHRRPASSTAPSVPRFSVSPCPRSARRCSRCSSTSPIPSGSAGRSAPTRSPPSRSPAIPSG